MNREDFIPKFSLEYLQRHPTVTIRYAKRQARLRWKTMEKRKLRETA